MKQAVYEQPCWGLGGRSYVEVKGYDTDDDFDETFYDEDDDDFFWLVRWWAALAGRFGYWLELTAWPAIRIGWQWPAAGQDRE